MGSYHLQVSTVLRVLLTMRQYDSKFVPQVKKKIGGTKLFHGGLQKSPLNEFKDSPKSIVFLSHHKIPFSVTSHFSIIRKLSLYRSLSIAVVRMAPLEEHDFFFL